MTERSEMSCERCEKLRLDIAELQAQFAELEVIEKVNHDKLLREVEAHFFTQAELRAERARAQDAAHDLVNFISTMTAVVNVNLDESIKNRINYLSGCALTYQEREWALSAIKALRQVQEALYARIREEYVRLGVKPKLENPYLTFL